MSSKNFLQTGILIMCGMSLVGCVSQRSHEQALQELQASQETNTQEIERLQEAVQEKQQEVVQLQQAKNDLEQAVEVQDQIKEQQLATVKKELENLYSQVMGIANRQGGGGSGTKIFDTDSIDYDDINRAFQQVRATLDAQVADFSQLREQNQLLEQELSGLEARLKEVERLKQELAQVREAREIQEAQLAKVKHEVQTVGGEIDRITKALEEKFGKSLMVTQHHDRLVLTMLGQVLFESGEAELTPLGLKIMKQVGQVLASLPEKYIQVEGHTDNNPIYGQLQKRYPTNWELSTARATTVLRYLIEQTGMDRNQLSATGYADTRPVQTNDSEEGRAQNRRVEIVLYPEQLYLTPEKVATLNP